jgi:hypothetical protein
VNTKRIFLAGLAAGFVLVVLDSITNALLFGASWEAAYKNLGLESENARIPIFWTTFDVLAGFLIAWLYASMRPRFGAGPRTAVYAALVEWSVLHLTMYSHVVDGVFPAPLLLGTSACELVSAVSAGFLAGRLYVELPGVEHSADSAQTLASSGA